MCAFAIGLCLANPALAQLAFVQDGESHRILGPQLAAGAVVWSHGRSVDREDELAPSPPYIEMLREQGWDAFRLNRQRAGDALGTGSHALALVARILKFEGYRKVVLAGQSFGAFISLMAAEYGDSADAVIAVAPAAFGRVTDNPVKAALNASRLYSILENVRGASIMLFYFKDDVFDPGGRGPRSEQILRYRSAPHIVIDQPVALETHWAGSGEAFADRFGPCILDFLNRGMAAAPMCHAIEFARNMPPVAGSLRPALPSGTVPQRGLAGNSQER